jgi:hypothetical protein
VGEVEERCVGVGVEEVGEGERPRAAAAAAASASASNVARTSSIGGRGGLGGGGDAGVISTPNSADEPGTYLANSFEPIDIFRGPRECFGGTFSVFWLECTLRGVSESGVLRAGLVGVVGTSRLPLFGE